VIGVDISEKMLAVAREKTNLPNVSYVRAAIEEYGYPENSFDVVISSLAFHYVESFDDICSKVNHCLAKNGDFIFSVEHPIFTAQGSQEWVYSGADNPLYWPVDNYFIEGRRDARFLGEGITKYHRTLTAYIGCLLGNGFQITGFCEPTPPEEMLSLTDMKDELRRPSMLIISAKRK